MTVADRPATRFKLAAQVGRVPSGVVLLDREQELCFQRLLEVLVGDESPAEPGYGEDMVERSISIAARRRAPYSFPAEPPDRTCTVSADCASTHPQLHARCTLSGHPAILLRET
jgi:hypothetical protein